MKWQVIKFRFLLWSKKILLTTLYSLVVLTVASYFILLIPSVQQSLIERYLGKFSKISGFDVTANSFYLVWWDRLTIEELNVSDPEKNELLHVRNLKVNFSFLSLLDGGNVNIDAVSLSHPNLHLTKIYDTDSTRAFNITILIDRINKLSSSGSGGPSSAKVNIGEIQWSEGEFTFDDSDRDSIKLVFDYTHFNLSIPALHAHSFRVIGDTIQFNLAELEATDRKTDFSIDRLSTFFRISQNALEFLNLQLKAGASEINDTVVFRYKSMAELNDFNGKVNLDLRLKNTTIHPADLALFAPSAAKLPYPLLLSGNIKGRVNKLTYSNMAVQFGSTQLAGSLSMDGLPHIAETFIDLNLKRSEVNMNDLAFALPKPFVERAQTLGKLRFNGSFTGFINDFVANGRFESGLGRIVSDINLKIEDNDPERSVYEGNLELTEFNLGAFLRDTTTFQKVSMKGKIQGRGFTIQTADFRLNGTIRSLGIRHYNYQNIVTNARFASSLFKGSLSVNDPHLQFHLAGAVNFRKGIEEVNIEAQIDTAELQSLGFSSKRFFIQTHARIQSKGLTLDSIRGKAQLDEILLLYDQDSLSIDSVNVTSTLLPRERLLRLQSSLVDVELAGDYAYSTLFRDGQDLFYEFLINIRNDQSAINEYYANKRSVQQDYTARFKVDMNDVNPLLRLINVKGYISKNAVLEGRLTNGRTSIISAYTSVDTLVLNNHTFFENEFELNGSKIRDSTTSLASVSFLSRKQVLNGSINTQHLLTEAIWNKDHVDLQLDIDQENIDNQVRLEAEIDFLTDTTLIRLLPSRIHLLDKDWVVRNDNKTYLTGREWLIENLEIYHQDEGVKVNGLISEDPEKSLNIDVTQFDLGILNTVSSEEFGGIVNGQVILKNLYSNVGLQNNITVTSLTVNSFLVGDIVGVNTWNSEIKQFDIQFLLNRLGKRTAEITGHLDPAKDDNPLQLKARFEQVNIKMIEPLLKDIFSEWDGTLTGDYEITGTFSRPKVRGEGLIKDGKIMINYLKTYYSFSGKLEMIPTQIIFKDFQLRDAFNNLGVLEGYIAHRNFQTYRLNLDASFNNFQLLNTSIKDNDLFYGEGYATGNLNIFGPANNLKISATARTGRNSRLYIPISGTSSVEKKDFIQFVHFTDTAIAKSIVKRAEKSTEPSGITLDFNIDLTPDAYAEIIFDIKAGDIIRGRGYGDLKIQLDTKGEFNMFGVVEFTEGAYNFTLYDIINKEFNIRPGSRISWFGDPYQGQLSINATYRQLASFGPTINNQSEQLLSAPGIRRKYPAEVVLKLEGPMLSPQIVFDIEAKDLPTNIVTPTEVVNLYLEFNAFKAKLDEQELKRQVFSLIVLRRFSPPNSFNTSGTLANSVSEFLSNQLSYWLTQVDQNLEIDLDLGALDAEAFNAFQLRLSYSLLGGRLRITRDGTFSSQYSQSNASSLVGDWTVDYVLTPDGKFKVKMYSRSNFNQVTTSLGTQNLITTGVSLTHTQSFNEFKDLLRSARNKRIKALEEQKLMETDSVENEN